jgi:hypothetical protein
LQRAARVPPQVKEQTFQLRSELRQTLFDFPRGRFREVFDANVAYPWTKIACDRNAVLVDRVANKGELK